MWRGYIWYNKINLNLWGCGYLKNGRPDFRDIKSFEEFSRYYWYSLDIIGTERNFQKFASHLD